MSRLGRSSSTASSSSSRSSQIVRDGDGDRGWARTQAELSARFPFIRECLPGQLLQLRLENWMAYTGPVEVNFLTGINLLAAPNGAGKSSLLCAMAFGLGYDVAHISRRGSRLRDFIKIGHNACSVSCVLAGRKPGEFVTTKRELRLSGDQAVSTFYINGNECGAEARIQFQRRMKLQVDNLICFMPQERVPEFATMRPEDLFMATLRAIDYDLHEAYAGLRDWEAQRDETEKLLTQGRADLVVLSRAVEKLRLEHEELKRLQSCEKERILCEGKILENRVAAVKASLKAQEREKQKTEKELRRANEKVRKVDEKLKEVQNVLRRVTEDRGRLTAKWRQDQESAGAQLEDFVADAMADVERLEAEIAALPEKALEWKRERERLAKEYALRHTVLMRAKAAEEKVRLEAEREKAHVAARMQEIQNTVAACNARRRELQQEAAEARLRVQTLEGEEQDLMRQALTERRKKAVLQENRQSVRVKNLLHFMSAPGGGDRTRQQSLSTALQLHKERKLKHTFGPVAFITQVKSARYRPYVEHLLQGRVGAFVCTDEEEMKFLSRSNCHALFLRTDLRGRVRLPTATAQMRELGVECFIHEQLEFVVEELDEMQASQAWPGDRSASLPTETVKAESAGRGDRSDACAGGAQSAQDELARRNEEDRKTQEARRREALLLAIRETVVSFTNANTIFVVRDSLTPQEEQRMQQFMKEELARLFQFPVRKLVYFKGAAVHSVQKSLHDNFWLDACDMLRSRLTHAAPHRDAGPGFAGASSPSAPFAGILEVVTPAGRKMPGEREGRSQQTEDVIGEKRVQVQKEREKALKRLEELEQENDELTSKRQEAVGQRQTLIEKDTRLAKAAHDHAFAKDLYEAVVTEIRALEAKRPGPGALLDQERRLQQRIWKRLYDALQKEREASRKFHALAESWLKMREEAAGVQGHRETLRKLQAERRGPAQEVCNLKSELTEKSAAIASLRRELGTRSGALERWSEEAALVYRHFLFPSEELLSPKADANAPDACQGRLRGRKRGRDGDAESGDRRKRGRGESRDGGRESSSEDEAFLRSSEDEREDFQDYVAKVKEDLKKAALPESEEELKAIINACTEELERTGGGNRQAFRDFKAKVQEKKKKESEVTKLEEKAQHQQKKINRVKESWHRRISEIVSTVSRRFSVFLKFINPDASGYVALHDPAASSSTSSSSSSSASSSLSPAPSVRDLELRICVSFYPGQSARPLNTRHSGGERSLCTVLYLLAVQAYAREGFRVLDEINQGLDGEKEKKLFALLTRVAQGWEGDESTQPGQEALPATPTQMSASPSGSPVSVHAPPNAGGGVQYVLLTPQLVKGTDYSAVCVHFPFNGRHLRLQQWGDEKALCAGAEEAVRRDRALQKNAEEGRSYILTREEIQELRQALQAEEREEDQQRRPT
ncbi:DEHA2A05324p, related [Neospora caninum Liverpool]|uniref:Structural maintenance of chromosomes protein 5 n=1 Tax=Neospora caninum (strain Liverpool) TaxID=572307 RepID=F0VPC2_NEOCL|nr:DEHA2A05324p, related [Neospora caninum Liverpool]CBZ55568.1 DEHA2A05324p, related [Neospora caninum Liverpool]CEL70310.1 TPA: DEHA2A05324p, related [Neospora caninum Liverpool]|eukprot:XP_003885596.1 DEHA2A05324p, related [Neospora caninum Liverpool]